MKFQGLRFDFASRRSMVTARRGMVATSNPLASQAGLAILRAGGNAADAAVAAGAVLNVTEPASTGIGGDMFALCYDARTRAVSAINGSGRAPAALHADDLRRQGADEIGIRSPHAVTVPGAVAGWADLLARHGTMPLSVVLADAIHYAESGYAVHPVFASSWRRMEPLLRASPDAGEYLPNGRTPRAGEIVRLPDLGRTLRAIAEGGAEAFYDGAIADAIVATLQTVGGVMTADDLRAHRSTWDDPIQTRYRGVRLYECPPNGQGIAALQALNIVQDDDLASMPWDSPERLHLLVEAMRLAFADARQYVADSATDPAPIEGLLSRGYAAQRRALIKSDHAMQPPGYGMPPAGSDTVYLSVVDGDGNACSFINSLYTGFGTGMVARGTGVMLQSRGALFSLEPGHPNELAPGKRPYHTIIPALATRDGALYASFGVMGGYMQPQGHMQMMIALLDDQLDPQAALDRPRWCLDSGSGDSELALEEGIPVATMARLADMGHRVRPVSGSGRGVFGDGQIIVRDAETGVLYGGSDPRKDGVTVGY
ncbi:MAG: gamma-glutamyltransferase [Chloroflexota bacterium]|nr:gamma-glutamyltransferase [Chloroflexota bacterium]